MYAVTSHPALAELFEQPGLEETLRQLGADPRINDVLSSGEPITGEKLAALMESPAILRLFDNREFVQTLKQVLHEVESEALLSANLDW